MSYVTNSRACLLLIAFCALASSLFAQTLVSRNTAWNDSVRVIVIWNSGTGGGPPDMPTGWNPAVGEIGNDTKNFVQKSLKLLNQNNIKYYTGSDATWNSINSFDDLKNAAFGGKLPHVIVYVNAGWTWDQVAGTKSHDPYAVIKQATDAGVGIVAVGDDAAYDAIQIPSFPLTGPTGSGAPIQYQWPMNGANSGKLWIALDKQEDFNLPDGGLLFGTAPDTMWFKDWQVGGRGQSDADAWSVNPAQLDNYSFVGFQQMDENGGVYGSLTDTINKPQILFNALAALQAGNHRIVMIDYQPQYLADTIMSEQVVYNSVFWASKAHEVLKIPMPIANPASGALQIGSRISLHVALANTSLYKIYYSINGTAPVIYTDSIHVTNGQPINLKAFAISTNPQNWLNSDTLITSYTVTVPKIPTPTVNPASGVVPLGSSITIKDSLANTGLYTIYYSVNGAMPVKGESVPVNSAQPFTLKAFAVSANPQTLLNSDTVTASYTVSLISISAIPGDGTKFGPDTSVTLIASAADAKIYYTLDGSVPDSTKSPYTGPILINKSCTIKAIAYKAAMLPATGSWSYIQRVPISNLLNDQTFFIKEKSPAGAAVGTVVLQVPDSIHVAFTQITSVPEFTFDPATRKITVTSGAVLNYDTKSSYFFKLASYATNAYSLIDTATVTIRLLADSLIPATATLLDTNHNGHLDEIDIKWTDTSAMKSVLPAVGDLVQALSLITLDKQNDVLHAIALLPDFSNKTIRIILQENTQFWETGWDSAKVNLSTVSVSVKGGYFQLNGIIDGALPIITGACYLPGEKADTLDVSFSEPPDAATAAAYLQNIKIGSKSGEKSLAVLGAAQSRILKSQILYVAPAGAISPYDNSAYLSFANGPPSPAVVIDYCHPLPLIVTSKAGPNPFDPNTAVPPGRHDGDPLHGIRIEILLNSSNTSSVGGDNRPATCSIFDAVGNVVMNEVGLKPDPLSVRKKYLIWDGKNKNGMIVAGGTYLARVTTEDKKTGSKVVKQILLGVKTVK